MLFQRRSLRTAIVTLVVCACVAVTATEMLQLARLYHANLAQADVVASNTARSLAEQTDATIKTADSIAAALEQRVETEGLAAPARARLYGLMTSLAAALPAIHEMGILDASGNALVKSLIPQAGSLNYSDRAYFQFHATHDDAAPFIGDRIRGKIDHTYNITVSRRINRPDGSFGGVVVASVSLAYFQRLFDQIQARSGGIIALLANDGTILVRSPPAAARPADDSNLWPHLQPRRREGDVSYVSTVDGVQRRGSYHRLQHYPLTILVAQSAYDLQHGWRSELRTRAIVVGCFMFLVVGLGSYSLKAGHLLDQQATHDALTGLPNRRVFNETIEHEFRRAARSGQPLSVVMMDLDHFKAYNDCYGHPAGDECLRAVSHVVQSNVRRAGEFAARYGGEEIALILPRYDSPRVFELAETIRLAVRDLALPHAASPSGSVSLSAGVATCKPGNTVLQWQDLVNDADTALYAAKKSGRNAVMASPPVPPLMPMPPPPAAIALSRSGAGTGIAIPELANAAQTGMPRGA